MQVYYCYQNKVPFCLLLVFYSAHVSLLMVFLSDYFNLLRVLKFLHQSNFAFNICVLVHYQVNE